MISDRNSLIRSDLRIPMAILAYGVNYRTAPVAVRERIAFPEETLAAALNQERDTIVDVVEPYLLSAGLLKRTARGRKATRAAYQHMSRVKEQPLELFTAPT